MKNMLNDLTDSVLTFESQKNYKAQTNQNMHCIKYNPSTQGCVNQECINNAFVCEQDECLCQQKHENCNILNIKKLIKNIRSKFVSTQSLQNFMDTKIQQIIDYLSQFQQNIKNWIKKQLNFLGLNQNEKQFLDSIEKGYFQLITGNKIWSILHPEQQKVPIKQFMKENIQILQNKFKFLEKSLDQNLKNITNEIKTYDHKIMNSKNQYVNLFIKSNQNSHILTQYNEAKILQTLFQKKEIKSVKLLYRASENNFQTSKFHDKCDGISSTLVLVKTQFDKKIGGYNSLKWSSSFGYQQDITQKQFLFSLTNNHKLLLTSKENAIYNDSSRGPAFGQTDLQICDKANQNNSSYTNVCNQYKNKNYQFDQNQSWEKFHGNKNSKNFKIKEWQVWHLQFQ